MTDIRKESEASQRNEHDVAYYSALVNAWFATRMERDKTLLSLSAGGVALLVGLLTSLGARSLLHLVLYFLAASAFLVAVLAAVAIFNGNAGYLERESAAFGSGRNGIGIDRRLKRLDAILDVSFAFGVVLTIAVSLMSGWSTCKMEDSQMSDEQSKENVSQSVPEKKSFSGASNMRPSDGPGSSGQQSGADSSGSMDSGSPSSDADGGSESK